MSPASSRWRYCAPWILALAATVLIGLWSWSRVSPVPGAFLVRALFDRGGERTARAMAAHVPAGLVEHLDQAYDESDPDARLDVFLPASASAPRTTVVWVHGGAFVAGAKEHVAPYLRVLAGRGVAAVGVGYSLAPRRRYPTPVLQVDAALSWLARNAGGLGLDTTRVVLAGDSAGAHIAAQLALAVRSPAYARMLGVEPSLDPTRLVGALLYCGPYDLESVDLDGPFGSFLRASLWAYTGERDPRSDVRFAAFSVARHVDASFPPAFVSAGNGDPLLDHSRRLVEALRARGVHCESLFFPQEHTPALGHEYQFELSRAEAREALDRSLEFLSGL